MSIRMTLLVKKLTSHQFSTGLDKSGADVNVTDSNSVNTLMKMTDRNSWLALNLKYIKQMIMTIVQLNMINRDGLNTLQYYKRDVLCNVVEKYY